MSGTNQRQSRAPPSRGNRRIGALLNLSAPPSPCREFAQSGEGGEVNEACNRARARYGLPPLIPLYKDILSLTTAEAATHEGFAVQSPAS